MKIQSLTQTTSKVQKSHFYPGLYGFAALPQAGITYTLKFMSELDLESWQIFEIIIKLSVVEADSSIHMPPKYV